MNQDKDLWLINRFRMEQDLFSREELVKKYSQWSGISLKIIMSPHPISTIIFKKAQSAYLKQSMSMIRKIMQSNSVLLLISVLSGEFLTRLKAPNPK